MIRAVRILVPVNGNPTDEEAVALACEVARRGKAAVSRYGYEYLRRRTNL